MGHSARPLQGSFKAQEPWQTSVEGQLKKQQTGRGAARQHAVGRGTCYGAKATVVPLPKLRVWGCYSVSFLKWIFTTKPRLVT